MLDELAAALRWTAIWTEPHDRDAGGGRGDCDPGADPAGFDRALDGFLASVASSA